MGGKTEGTRGACGTWVIVCCCGRGAEGAELGAWLTEMRGAATTGIEVVDKIEAMDCWGIEVGALKEFSKIIFIILVLLGSFGQ